MVAMDSVGLKLTLIEITDQKKTVAFVNLRDSEFQIRI